MDELERNWRGRIVRWVRHSADGNTTRTGTVLSVTPAELLVEDHATGAATWITGEEDGFTVLEDRDADPREPDAIDAADATTAGGFEVGDAVSWTPYYAGEEAGIGHIAELGDHGSHVVRRTDGHTFRVAADRIQHRAAIASHTITNADGTGIRLEVTPRGVDVHVFNTRGTVTLGFGRAAELTAWLADQMHNPANDYSAR